jgi:putative flavoprotein involved in K+ transport
MRAETDVLIVGAGHGGLAVAHDLIRAGRDVLLVDAHARVGDAWRMRWDSLRLFTPRKLDGLPEMPFPNGGAHEMGLPVRLGAAVRAVHRAGAEFEARSATMSCARARS